MLQTRFEVLSKCPTCSLQDSQIRFPERQPMLWSYSCHHQVMRDALDMANEGRSTECILANVERAQHAMARVAICD